MKTIIPTLYSPPRLWKLEASSPMSFPRFQLRALAVSQQQQKKPAAKRSSKPSKTPLPTAPTSTNLDAADPPNNKKVLVPIGFGTEEMEFVIMVDVLRRAGAEVTVASVEQELEVEASGGVRLLADSLISNCSGAVFDLIALPGGMPGSARLRDCKILQEMTMKQAEEKRFYGAISAAPAVTLLPWGLLKRRQMTGHPAFNDKLPTFWAVKSNNHVYGELTTSRGPGTSYEFALSLVDQLFGDTDAKRVKDSVLLDDGNDGHRKEELNEAKWSLNHSPQVLLPVSNGCEGIEVVTIVDILRRARANVVVASVEKSMQISVSQGLTIVADKLISAAAEATYDMIILPGGASGLERLQKSRILKKLLKEHHIGGGIFGAMNSSLPILQRQGLLKDKVKTADDSALSDTSDIINSAGVVIDGKLITSKGLSKATDFGLAIVSKFFGHARARSVAEGLVFEYPQA